MRSPAAVITTLAVVSVLASCTDERGSSGAPPVVVCGQTVSRTAAGPVITDATRRVTVTQRSVGVGDVYLLLTRRCDRGAAVSYLPGSADQAAVAHTRDHRLAMLVLTTRRNDFDLTVRPASGRPYTVAIRLDG